MRWDLLCPRCRVAKAAVQALDQLPQGAHCATCNIDYDRNFSRNVELSFQPAPAVRPLGTGEHCLFGPMSTPHIWLQRSLDPGARLREPCDLPAGSYRLRTLEAGPEEDVTLAPGATLPEVRLTGDALRLGGAGAAGEVVLHNAAARPLTVIVEERRWARDALTADRVTALQAFRDLFSDQVLRPGDEVSVARVTLLFTDLRRSTDLYGRLITSGEFDALMEALRSVKRVVIVNVKVPRRWEGQDNDEIRAGVARWPNAVMLDWNAEGNAHPEFFWDDGYHLRPEGAAVYADLIAKAAGV
jgi:hypothetical protein